MLILIPSIYFLAYKKSTLVFTIGNYNGNISYVPNYNRITDIIIDIDNNIDISNSKIQNILIKSSKIEIDLMNYINLKDYESVIKEVDDIESLILTIKKYTKEKIIIKLLKEKNILYEYANKKISLLAKKYDIMVVR